MSSDEHEQGHNSHRRPVYGSGDGKPHEEIAGKALDSPSQMYDPWPAVEKWESPLDGARLSGDSGIKETGENSGVGTDIFENRDGIESGLIVKLGGLEDRGVDAEGVRCTAAALDPYASHRC